MSLTSEIKRKDSPVRQFFAKYENQEGRKECLTLLQSTRPILLPQFVPTSDQYYRCAGTTVDYLIRYAANGNSLAFEDTIAYRALELSSLLIADSDRHRRLGDLYEIGRQYLNGRDASDPKAVYSATALTLLDNFFRSRGRLPELFAEQNAKYHREQIEKFRLSDVIHKSRSASSSAYIKALRERRKQRLSNSSLSEVKVSIWLDREQTERLGLNFPEGRKRFQLDVNQVDKLWQSMIKDRPTDFLFDAFYKTLGGELYTEDVSELIRTFVDAINSPDSELFSARFVVSNQALENSQMVGGADFDCVIEYDDRLILTDIKTTTKRLATEHFRQILGYALLYDEKKDGFKFTDIGIYHSRSGSFRFLPIGHVVEKGLTGFKSVDSARKAFISEIEKI